jgi:hypothetical protein
MSFKVPKFDFGDNPSAKPAKVANLQPVEAPQASPPERILSCSECPWYQLNLWTHQQELGAWCWWHVDGILADNPACISYWRGEVPERRERRKEHE